MNRVLVSGVLLLLLIPSLVTAEDGPDMNFTIDYVSKFIFRGADILDNGGAIQPSLTLESESGLLLNVWASAALSDRDNFKTADEVDLIAEYSTALGELFGFTTGTIAYLYPRSQLENGELAGRSAAEAYFILLLEEPIFNPSLKFAYDFMTGNNGYLEFGIEHSQNLAMFDITASANMGYDNGQFIDKSTISHVDLALTPSLSFQNLEVYGQVHYVIVPDQDVGINDEDEFWFGIGLSSDFTLIR